MENEFIEKFKGLTSEEVEDRKSKGLVHTDVTVPTKSIKQIILDNTLTPFNFLNFGLVAVIIVAGLIAGDIFTGLKNCLFIGTVFFNMFISMFNEIRSKKIVDKLSLLDEAKILVVRDGKKQEIIGEIADLIFHLSVEMGVKEISWNDVFEELKKR